MNMKTAQCSRAQQNFRVGDDQYCPRKIPLEYMNYFKIDFPEFLLPVLEAV